MSMGMKLTSTADASPMHVAGDPDGDRQPIRVIDAP